MQQPTCVRPKKEKKAESADPVAVPLSADVPARVGQGSRFKYDAKYAWRPTPSGTPSMMCGFSLNEIESEVNGGRLGVVRTTVKE